MAPGPGGLSFLGQHRCSTLYKATKRCCRSTQEWVLHRACLPDVVAVCWFKGCYWCVFLPHIPHPHTAISVTGDQLRWPVTKRLQQGVNNRVRAPSVLQCPLSASAAGVTTCNYAVLTSVQQRHAHSGEKSKGSCLCAEGCRTMPAALRKGCKAVLLEPCGNMLPLPS